MEKIMANKLSTAREEVIKNEFVGLFDKEDFNTLTDIYKILRKRTTGFMLYNPELHQDISNNSMYGSRTGHYDPLYHIIIENLDEGLFSILHLSEFHVLQNRFDGLLINNAVFATSLKEFRKTMSNLAVVKVEDEMGIPTRVLRHTDRNNEVYLHPLMEPNAADYVYEKTGGGLLRKLVSNKINPFYTENVMNWYDISDKILDSNNKDDVIMIKHPDFITNLYLSHALIYDEKKCSKVSYQRVMNFYDDLDGSHIGIFRLKQEYEIGTIYTYMAFLMIHDV